MSAGERKALLGALSDLQQQARRIADRDSDPEALRVAQKLQEARDIVEAAA